jgi:hypothetical protein
MAFDQPGDDADKCGLLGGDPGEIRQILLAFARNPGAFFRSPLRIPQPVQGSESVLAAA